MWSKIKNVLGSPRTIALLIVVIVLAVLSIFGAKLNQDEVITATIAFVGFILSVAATGTPTVWAQLFGSFRFWSLLISLAFIFLRAFVPGFPLTENVVLTLVSVLTGASISFSYRPINQSVT